MHLLPCPVCQTNISVTPAQAGDEIKCPSCEASVALPTLGELRQLPRAETETQESKPRSDAPLGNRIAFAVCALVAVAGLLSGGYSGIRWALLPAPITTEDHLMEIESRIRESSPAVMIREYEDMEKLSLDLTAPYTYVSAAKEKNGWLTSTLALGGIGVAFMIASIVFLSRGRERKTAA